MPTRAGAGVRVGSGWGSPSLPSLLGGNEAAALDGAADPGQAGLSERVQL